jgi:N-acetylneuraminic acid mutarotase
LNGYIYVFGGVTGPSSQEILLNTTWIYDEANDGWFQGANMPGFRFSSAVATDGAVIWVIGGYQSVSFGDVTNTVWMYDPSTDAYSTVFANMSTYLGRIHGVELPDGTVHVFGGHYEMNNHLVYDAATDAWSSAPSMPFWVLDPAVVTDGTVIYLGGGNGDVPRPPRHTQIYDPASGAWSQGPPMPAPAVNNTSGAIANGTFYVIGGYDGTGPVSVNYSLSLFELKSSGR